MVVAQSQGVSERAYDLLGDWDYWHCFFSTRCKRDKTLLPRIPVGPFQHPDFLVNNSFSDLEDEKE